MAYLIVIAMGVFAGRPCLWSSDMRASCRWWVFSLLAAAFLLPPVSAEAAGSPPTVAIANFGFIDTSGEARDQRAEHDARLKLVMARVRKDLTASGKFHVVDVLCGEELCGPETPPAQELDEARKAGADFLLLGEIHKTSTLVLSLKAQVIDARSKLVFERFLSFRGDADEAWQHAAHFLARDLIASPPAIP